jgi:hypothetical protein
VKSRRGCGNNSEIKEEMGDGFGKGAREKTDGDVGWANGRKLGDKAGRLAGDIGGSASELGKGRNVGEHEVP